MVSRAGSVFDADGRIVDGRTDEALRRYLAGFVAYVRGHAAGAGA
jgi:hypothetical protein